MVSKQKQPESQTLTRPGPTKVQNILNNLEIRFMNCTFIFTQLPVSISSSAPVPTNSNNENPASSNTRNQTGSNSSKPKFLSKWARKVFHDIAANAKSELCGREQFSGCIFSSAELREQVANQIKPFETKETSYSFVNCKFIQKQGNFLEKLGIKMRRFVGALSFEVNEGTGVVIVEGYTLKLKDIPMWSSHIRLQIIEED